MKKLVLSILGAAFLVNIGFAQKVDVEAEKSKVKKAVDQFAEVWDTKNMDLASKIIAKDPDLIFIGTDSSEYFVGWEPLKAYMEQFFPLYDNSKLTVKNQAINVHESGTVAWFSEILDWSLVMQGQPVTLKGLRLTGLLEKRNGSWVFVQFHASVPQPG